MKLSVKDIARLGITTALYVVFSLITYPISFLGIQFRFAEIMILLCFFRKDYVISITLGCVLVNLTSPIGFIDAAIGGAATLISCVIIMFTKQLVFSVIIGTVINAFLVGFELYKFLGEPFWISVGYVALGEFVVLLIGYIFVMVFKKRPSFYKMINANQNIDFKF